MPARRLLYLGTHQLAAYRWQAGTLLGEGTFEATEEGHRAFADYLGTHRASLFALLVNVPEEGFQIETIPFLRGADRQAVLARKSAQLFFNAPLSATRSLGYAKTRRKDERVLVAALTNNAFFEPWLAAFERSQALLSGIWSLPLLGGTLLDKLGLASENCLLLSVQDQSIRQSYFEKGELHFSRLAPLHNSSIVGIAQGLAAEAVKLQQYLISQRTLGRGQPITANILAHPGALKAIEASCIDTETLRFNLVDLHDCARRSGLRTLPPASHCETLFLHLLAAAPPATQFADDSLRHGYHLWRIRSALNGAAAILLLGCLLFAGKQQVDIDNTERRTAEHLQAASDARQRYESIVATFPPLATDSETLRRALDRYAGVAAGSPLPDALFRDIGQGLQAVPAIAVDAIDWQPGSIAETDKTGAAGEARDPDETHETAIVRGHLDPDGNDTPRRRVETFERFLAALRTVPSLHVEVIEQPFDTASGKSLRGGAGDDAAAQPQPFVLRASRRSDA